MAFSFNELDSLLLDNQYAIAKRGNFDLPFGGTTDAEFDFLAKNGAVNTMAPNFLSFMAGMSASNLATQANRQQQFEQFGKLREANSVIANRDSATRNNLLEGDSRELQMPYVGSLAQAQSGLAGQNWRHQQLVNDNYQRDFNSLMDSREAQTKATRLNNTQQEFVNDNLQSREDIYNRSQNAQIDQVKGQTENNKYIAQLSKFKADTAQQLHELDVQYKNKQITREQYESEKAKAQAKYFNERKRVNSSGWWFPTADSNKPTQSQQSSPSVLNTGQNQGGNALQVALIKQVQGIQLSQAEAALLKGFGLMVGDQ
jgi:hypothetical protein